MDDEVTPLSFAKYRLERAKEDLEEAILLYNIIVFQVQIIEHIMQYFMQLELFQLQSEWILKDTKM